MAKYPELPAIAGIKLGYAASGLRDKDDLALIEIAAGSKMAAVFTKNQFAAAPVKIARNHIKKMAAITDKTYCIINAGNANAGNGAHGHDDCLALCRSLATQLKCPIEAILPFSTGIIGQRLPVNQLCKALPDAVTGLKSNSWHAAAAAITTTDRFNKTAYRQWQDSTHSTVTATGICKGAGMICPDMATMLAFIACDAAIEKSALHNILTEAVADSFNRISVDGDTSTNDAVVLIATGLAYKPHEDTASDIELCRQNITDLCRDLAYQIVRDGEGASRLIEIHIHNATSKSVCQHIARTVASSPLVKTAFFGCDPNWGRIMAAVGRSGVELDEQKFNIKINGNPVVTGGVADSNFDKTKMAQQMRECNQLKLEIEIGNGNASDYIVTCDLGHEYVNLNSNYSS